VLGCQERRAEFVRGLVRKFGQFRDLRGGVQLEERAAFGCAVQRRCLLPEQLHLAPELLLRVFEYTKQEEIKELGGTRTEQRRGSNDQNKGSKQKSELGVDGGAL